MFRRCAILLAAAVSGCAGQELAGRVVEDSSGSPIAGAELRFRQAGKHELAADLDTDRQGRILISDLPAGDYTLEVRKTAYLAATLPVHVPASGLMVRLVRLGVISGHVFDIEGKPLQARATAASGRTTGSTRVAVLVKTPGTAEPRMLRMAEMDDSGGYRAPDLPPGEYSVGVWYGGIENGTGAQIYPETARPRWFAVSGGEDYRDIDFVVARAATVAVSGKVEGTKMTYSVALGLPEASQFPISLTVTDASGAFRFEKVPAGEYEIFVAGPVVAYAGMGNVIGQGETFFGRTRVQVGAQDVENVSVTVGAGRSASVILRAQEVGKAAQCPKTASVTFSLAEPWGLMFSREVTANFEKEQAITGLPPGRFRLAATELGAGCYEVNRPVVDLTGGDAAKAAAIELASAGRLKGTLRTGAAVAKGFAVVLIAADAAGDSTAMTAYADDDGHFSFDGLRPGSYRIAARPADGGARWIADVARMIEIEIAGGGATEIDLPVAPAKGDAK